MEVGLIIIIIIIIIFVVRMTKGIKQATRY